MRVCDVTMEVSLCMFPFSDHTSTFTVNSLPHVLHLHSIVTQLFRS